MSGPACAHCRHYRPKTDQAGTCWRYPPVPLLQSDGDTMDAVPWVNTPDLCGEYNPKAVP